MKRIFFILSVFILFAGKSIGQADSADMHIRDVHYDIDTENYFSDYKDAKLIANYYCAKGLSEHNRYSFEVVVIDSILMCGFDSPETETMNYISYQKKQMLTPAQATELKNTLENAGLKQLKLGIPRPDAAAHTKEVLIVRYGKLKIQGGMIHDELQEDLSAAERADRAAKERRQTSSIGGNYDKLIEVMTGFFTDLDMLRNEALKSK